MRPRRSFGPRTFGTMSATIAAVALIRRTSLRWGATRDEAHRVLAGDELMTSANLQSTRAITISASADRVWPWIVQLGQNRGGFYSYDFLENLVGANIHSADSIVPDWQRIEVGDQVLLGAEMPLFVARIDQARTLVLRGGVAIGALASPMDFTWAFVLVPGQDGETRLVVRERYRYTRRWAGLLVEPTELVSFLMTARMLRGIRDRAERSLVASPVSRLVSADRAL